MGIASRFGGHGNDSSIKASVYVSESTRNCPKKGHNYFVTSWQDVCMYVREHDKTYKYSVQKSLDEENYKKLTCIMQYIRVSNVLILTIEPYNSPKIVSGQLICSKSRK